MFDLFVTWQQVRKIERGADFADSLARIARAT
jgi:hypothetical protein